MAHSRIGASSAYRWMACPGSVQLTREIEATGVDVTSPDSPAGIEGTLAHAILAACLINDIDAWELAMEEGVTSEMIVHVQTTLDELRRFRGTRFIEQKISLAHLHPDAFGTLDFAVTDWHDTLTVIDFKYGRYNVDPVNNPQLKFYALGMLELAPLVENIRIGIIQPKVQGPNVVWGGELTRTELEQWGKELKHCMDMTDDESAPLSPGTHCHFCPVKSHCPAQSEMISDTFAGQKSPKDMTDKELGDRLSEAKHLKAYFDTLEAEAYSRLEANRKVEGWKLVPARTARKWADGAEQKVVDAYGERAYKKTLQTPAAIEKLPGGTTLVHELAFFPKGNLTIAPTSDTRRSAGTSALAAFEQYLVK